jgi:hypothetical protein
MDDHDPAYKSIKSAGSELGAEIATAAAPDIVRAAVDRTRRLCDLFIPQCGQIITALQYFRKGQFDMRSR